MKWMLQIGERKERNMDDQEEVRIVSLKDFCYFALIYANGVSHMSEGQVDQLIAYTKTCKGIDVEESPEELHRELCKYLILCFGVMAG